MSDSEGSDISESNIPARDECERRCQAFADATGTDTALAMFYLQDRDWDLQRSIDAYMQSSHAKSRNSEKASASNPEPKLSLGAQIQMCKDFMEITTSSRSTANTLLNKTNWNLQQALDIYLTSGSPKKKEAEPPNTAEVPGVSQAGESGASSDGSVDPMPHRIRIMSWNIDGLDTNNIKTRTVGVCKNIQQDQPDVVFLQEVIPQTLELIEKLSPEYHVLSSKETNQYDYFVAMLLKSSNVKYQDHSVISFYSSKMGRNLLKVQASVKGVPMLLMTSHLESTKSHAGERKKQLQRCFQEMKEGPPDCTVIFGGDLNLRDKELAEIGGIPDAIYDLWEVTGKRKEAQYTWDLSKNDNLNWEKQFRPKCRFDRLYLRHPANKQMLKPRYFELAGIQRLQKCKRFCSDHWGILTHYDKT